MAERNYYWDNLRFVLIALVVGAHFINAFSGDSQMVVVFRGWIYLFHMPAFLFVSGAFAKKMYSKEKGLNVNTIVFYLICFIIFYSALWFYRTSLGENLNYAPFVVGDVTWYFLTLATLCASTPIFANIKGGWKTVIPFLTIFALLIGFSAVTENFLSMGRTISFAPFFYAGYFVSINGMSETVKKAQEKVWPIVACIAILVGLLVIMSLLPKELVRTLYLTSTGHHAYPNIEFYDIATCFSIKLIWYVVATVMIAALAVLVPTKKTPISNLGGRTLQVYLLHVFIYFAFRNLGVYEGWMIDLLPWTAIGMFALGVVCTILLAIPTWPNELLTKARKSINVVARE